MHILCTVMELRRDFYITGPPPQ